MRSDTVLDYAVFELSPKHSRCELFVSSNEETEKVASGLIKPFVNHLRLLESQSSPVRLEVDNSKGGNNWFTKRTLERFVQFVISPEALEKVNTCYSEMSQLEAARTLYSQRSEDSKFGASDDGAAADATKKELLRAIDLRLEAIKKDLTTSIAHASVSGFDPHTVSELQLFADRFGAHHLDKACSKYISLWKKRPDLFDMQHSNVSIEEDGTRQKQNMIKKSEHQIQESATTSSRTNEDEKNDESMDVTSSTVKTSQHTRRLSVQDRINLFESKQKENSNSGGSKPVIVTKSTELRRLSSDLAFSEKSVPRRNSIVSDMSIDLASEKKLESSMESPFSTPLPVPHTSALTESGESVKKDNEVKHELKGDFGKAGDEDSVNSSKPATEKSLVSGAEATSDAQSRSITDSKDSSASQNQTDSYVDRLRNVMSDAKSRQREEGHELKANNVSQPSSVMFPSRHARSRSAHVEAVFQEDLASQPQYRTSVGRIKKKEVVPSKEQPVLSQKPQFSVRDGPDDGEGRQVRANSHRVPTASVDQIQRTRLPKENPGANDELKMKANELEKLFAEHKLRVPGDQSSSSRRGKPSETQVVQAEPSHSIGTAEKSFGSGDLSKFMTPLVGEKDKGDGLRRNFSDLSLMDDSKGKFYDKYMKKRDAKLREEWSLKKSEKETKLKSMQEALEQSRTEMKAKLSASSSSERQDSLSSTRQRAEKFRSFNARSTMKKYQHPINSFQSEEDEDCSDQKPRAKDKPASGQQSSVGSIASRSSQARKLQPNRSMSSSITPRTTAGSVPKPSGKVSNTSSGRRRSDKSLAQSVPNFSELIKENTKPPSLAVKTTMRSQVRSSGRIKNTKEDTLLQRPQSLRKSSSGNIDFTELSADDMMASLRVDSDISENLKNEEYDEPEAEAEEALENAVREDEEEEDEVEEFETPVFKDGNPTLTDVYEKVDNSGEENCSFLPATLPSTLLTVTSLMDSPGESPLSWNANLQHSFSYPHEHSSDVDASADSPTGSPASWSSRMRKKWGTAQSPVTVAAAAAASANNSSQLQSRRDLTKGFKRLLKFGRKSRGAESLMMDWVSVTTSEGDDEVEDRRDLADRSSDDLRKSRMGSLQSHLSEDGFNESEFTEQASNISVPEDHQISGSNIKAQKSFFWQRK